MKVLNLLLVQVVKLSDMTCSCGKWTLYHLPCSHVMAACAHTSLDVSPFVDRCYTLEQHLASYSPQFQPIPHPDYWNESDMLTLLPPFARIRKKGRPRSTRMRNEMDWQERGPRPRCRICRQEGHDRRTCPNTVTN